MGRQTNRLTHRFVQTVKDQGWHADGDGLYLRVTSDGKRWVFVFQWFKKRAEMGLGSAADVGVAEARDLRDAARDHLKAGRNPIDERRREREEAAAAAAAPDPETFTFEKWVEEIGPVIGPKAEKAQKAWVSSITAKMPTLKVMAPAEIQTEHVLAALKPYWLSRPETGGRMRARLENVLDAAKAKGHISDPSWVNPARWKGHLQHLLAKQEASVRHHSALPYERMPEFMRTLRALDDRKAALALEFTILTAARTSETLGARWSEIDWAEEIWVVPAERMKAGREHRVPLTKAALAILERVKPLNRNHPCDLVFESPTHAGREMSENTMQKVLIDMDLKGVATVHGMRSAFKDWAEDCTNFATGVIEAALAHLVGDQTERAYRRSDALMKRRKLMEAWEGYAAGRRGNVTPLSSVRR